MKTLSLLWTTFWRSKMPTLTMEGSVCSTTAFLKFTPSTSANEWIIHCIITSYYNAGYIHDFAFNLNTKILNVKAATLRSEIKNWYTLMLKLSWRHHLVAVWGNYIRDFSIHQWWSLLEKKVHSYTVFLITEALILYLSPSGNFCIPLSVLNNCPWRSKS